MKKNRKKSKGLSLVELVVAVAISSVVMLLVTNVISSSLKSYTRENSKAQAQNENQLTMSKISDVLMEAQAFVKDGNLIETSLKDDVGEVFLEEVGKSIYYDATKETLYLTSKPWARVSGAEREYYMLAENVVDYRVEFDSAMSLYTVQEEVNGSMSSVTYLKEHPTFKVTLVIRSNKRDVEYTQSVVFRNAMTQITVDGTTYNAKQ